MRGKAVKKIKKWKKEMGGRSAHFLLLFVFHVLDFYSNVLSEILQLLHTFPNAGAGSLIAFLIKFLKVCLKGHYKISNFIESFHSN